jgi:D-alanine-D-alanine ligase-like ATP-grasp enzyme
MHEGFKNIAIALTKDMGLRLCGVDLLVEGDISEAPEKYAILETNAAPGLDHYASSGTEQTAVVEDLYRSVLHALEI